MLFIGFYSCSAEKPLVYSQERLVQILYAVSWFYSCSADKPFVHKQGRERETSTDIYYVVQLVLFLLCSETNVIKARYRKRDWNWYSAWFVWFYFFSSKKPLVYKQERERETRTSILHGLVGSIPSLARLHHLLCKAGKQMNRQYGLIINNIHYIASIILSFSFSCSFSGHWSEKTEYEWTRRTIPMIIIIMYLQWIVRNTVYTQLYCNI